MSAITLFSRTTTLVSPRTGCECVRTIREQTIRYTRVPVVSPRWTVEVNERGNRRLVEHWFKNQ